MNKTFEITSALRASDFDKHDKILPSAVLDLFQSVAGQHSIEMGVGYKKMAAEKGILWVLVKVKFQKLKEPEMYENVTVRTWPLMPGRVSFERDYEILGKNGDTLIKGTSEWVFIDKEKRRLVPAKGLYPEMEFKEERTFDEKLLKVPPFAPEDEGHLVHAEYSDIDLNKHVNNTKYANFVLNAIDPDDKFDIDIIQIDYKKELLEGDDFRVHLLKEDGYVRACGKSGNNLYFNCGIKLKKKDD